MEKWIEKDIKSLKSIGERWSSCLEKELGIRTLGDLVHFFPVDYEDRTQVISIKDIHTTDKKVQLLVCLKSFIYYSVGPKKRLVAKFRDTTGEIEVIWFNYLKGISAQLKKESNYLVFGKPSFFNGKRTISHPKMQLIKDEKDIVSSYKPVYRITTSMKKIGFTSRKIEQFQKQLLDSYSTEIEESLPDYIKKEHSLVSKKKALNDIHFPINNEDKKRC